MSALKEEDRESKVMEAKVAVRTEMSTVELELRSVSSSCSNRSSSNPQESRVSHSAYSFRWRGRIVRRRFARGMIA